MAGCAQKRNSVSEKSSPSPPLEERAGERRPFSSCWQLFPDFFGNFQPRSNAVSGVRRRTGITKPRRGDMFIAGHRIPLSFFVFRRRGSSHQGALRQTAPTTILHGFSKFAPPKNKKRRKERLDAGSANFS